jgi:hypothetical protein
MIIVFVIAAGAVGREAHLLDAVPARPVFDPDEATTWIAEHLPPQTTAAVSYDDVQNIVNWTVELLRQNAGVVVTSGEVPDAGQAVVVDEESAVANAMSRSAAAGRSLVREDAHAAVAAVFAYLETIGAVGPVADET